MGAGTPDEADHEARLAARRLLREFLRAVPRAEAEATVTLPRPGGGTTSVTRAQASAAVDALRPRARQVVRLTLEAHRQREDAARYLYVSVATVERDQAEAQDEIATRLLST